MTSFWRHHVTAWPNRRKILEISCRELVRSWRMTTTSQSPPCNTYTFLVAQRPDHVCRPNGWSRRELPKCWHLSTNSDECSTVIESCCESWQIAAKYVALHCKTSENNFTLFITFLKSSSCGDEYDVSNMAKAQILAEIQQLYSLEIIHRYFTSS